MQNLASIVTGNRGSYVLYLNGYCYQPTLRMIFNASLTVKRKLFMPPRLLAPEQDLQQQLQSAQSNSAVDDDDMDGRYFT